MENQNNQKRQKVKRIKSQKQVKTEQELLIVLNDFLEYYPSFSQKIDFFDEQSDKYFELLVHLPINMIKSYICTSLAIIGSEYLLGSQPINEKVLVLIAATTIGTIGLQINTSKSIERASKLEIIEKQQEIEQELTQKLLKLLEKIVEYLNSNNYTAKDLYEKNLIQKVFDHQDNFIEKMKSECKFNFEFDYNVVQEVLNDMFECENGAYDVFYEFCDILEKEEEKTKTHKKRLLK